MTTIASQITSLTVVYSTVYSDADQRKHQSAASLAFVWGIHRDRWIPRTKGQLRGKCFHLMTSSCIYSGTPLERPGMSNLAHFYVPFFTNHVYFTPHDRPLLLKGHHIGWPFKRGSAVCHYCQRLKVNLIPTCMISQITQPFPIASMVGSGISNYILQTTTGCDYLFQLIFANKRGPWHSHSLHMRHFLAATKQLYEWFSPSVRPSVCLSVCLSVTPFSLCSHHRIVTSWNFQDLLSTNDRSDVLAKGQGQRSMSQRSKPYITVSGP